jgi:hypothetical protein
MVRCSPTVFDHQQVGTVKLTLERALIDAETRFDAKWRHCVSGFTALSDSCFHLSGFSSETVYQ